MDILIVILALMGLVLIPWGTAAGISGLFAEKSRQLPPDNIGDRVDLPALRNKISPDYRSAVTRAYRNRLTGQYVARVSCPDLDKHNWVHAKSEKELRREIDRLFRRNGEDCLLKEGR